MKNSFLVVLGVVVLVLAGGVLWWSPWQAQAPSEKEADVAMSEQEEDPPPFVVDERDPSQEDVSGEDDEVVMEEPSQNQDTGDDVTSEPIQRVTVTYSDSGFSPAATTISRGDTIVFVNNSANPFWPAIDLHPTHTQYDGTTRSQHCPDPQSTVFDACESIAPGGMYEFTFNQAGQWNYHDHMRASQGGTVIVE